jgi:hypothetical protein
MTVHAGTDLDILEANLAFHLVSGVDAIVVWAASGDRHGSDVLERLGRDDRVHRAPAETSVSASSVSNWTVDSFAADWLIETESCEFWWPRTKSVSDALTAVPFVSNAAQAIVRTLFPTTSGKRFEECFTMRLSPRAPSIDERWRSSRRFAVRSAAIGNRSDLDVLWGYYPFEVLRLAESGRIEPSDPATQRALELGVLVPDTRLRDALGSLRRAQSHRPAFDFDAERLTFTAPGPTDEALFALEAAVLDDVELSLARQQLDVLSQRLRVIENSRLLRVEARLRRTAGRCRRMLKRKPGAQ